MYRKILSWLLTLAMVFTMIGGVNISASGLEFKDVENHWAKDSINQWIEKGLIKGYSDGTFKPNGYITRGEFITLVNNVINSVEETEINFDDVSGEEWYYRELQKAIFLGYIKGYEDNTFRANENISRQEVGVISQKIVQLDPSDENDLESFIDTSDIPEWSRDALQLAVQKGYLTGYEDNSLKASNYITRAESVKVLNNLFGLIYNEPGLYGPSEDEDLLEVEGNVTVSVKDVTLQNMIVEGDLYLTEGIGEGEVTLDNVEVIGDTIVKGGGENSIIIKNSSLKNLIIIKKDGKVRILAQGDTNIKNTKLQSSGKLQGEERDNFDKVEIIKVNPGEAVELEGYFNKVEVNTKVDIEVNGKSRVEEVNVSKDTEGVLVKVSPYSIINKLIANTEVDVDNRGVISEALGEFAGTSTYENRLPVNLQPKTSSSPSTPAAPKYTLSLTVTPAGFGTVSGGGSYEEGKDITITASANEGYEFVEWKDGDRSFSTSTSFSYTMPSENTVLTGVFKEKEFAGGSGTETDPYQVANAVQLNKVRNHLSSYFIQTADIDLADYVTEGGIFYNEGEGWEPIGDIVNRFEGSYNGDGYTISNLFIERPSENYVGLFGINRGSLKNIKLENIYVTGNEYVGGIVGSIDSDAISLFGSVVSSYSSGTVSGNRYIGGLTGASPGNYLQISRCFSSVSVSGNWGVGGLVGMMYGSISNCYATGDITGSTRIGGLVGEPYGTITNCYSIGFVIGTTDVGGLLGGEYVSNVVNSYYDSNTSGQSDNSGKGIPKTTVEMQNQATYVGWDFTNVWTINDNFNNGYPTLRWVEFAGGSGTESEPYLIATPEHLDNVRNHLNSYFVQVADIDLDKSPFNEGTGWEPIGSWDSDTRFKGSYDGDNFTIYNLKINDPDRAYLGLFGVVGHYTTSSEMKNITIDNLNISGNSLHSVGGLAGIVDRSAFVYNCHVDGVISSFGTVGYAVGGLIGSNSGNLKNSSSTVNLSINTTTSNNKIGGLTGDNGGTIENCLSSGDVTGKEYVGGLVGWNGSGNISKSYSSSNVHGVTDVGGLVGLAWGQTQESYSTGSVSGTSNVGGLIGNLPGKASNCYSTSDVSGSSSVGGLVGFFSGGGSPGEIVNCYSNGSITCISIFKGGLVASIWGSSSGHIIENSYWDTETSGLGTSAGGTGYVTSAMIKSTNSVLIYEGWDFDTIWNIDEGTSYPYLRNNEQTPHPVPIID